MDPQTCVICYQSREGLIKCTNPTGKCSVLFCDPCTASWQWHTGTELICACSFPVSSVKHPMPSKKRLIIPTLVIALIILVPLYFRNFDDLCDPKCKPWASLSNNTDVERILNYRGPFRHHNQHGRIFHSFRTKQMLQGIRVDVCTIDKSCSITDKKLCHTTLKQH